MKKVILLAIIAISFMAVSFTHDNTKTKSQAEDNSQPMAKPMYCCPMHPEEKMEMSGKCPKCGMDMKEMKMPKAMYSCPMHPEEKMDKKGKCPKCGMDMKEMKMPKKMYTCPMHPEIVKNKRGKCPKCGMTLVKKSKTTKKESMRGMKM